MCIRDRYDGAAVYTLGPVWIQAIVDELGEEALSCLISEAKGREPQVAIQHWEAVMKACGGDLNAIGERYERLLEDAAESLPQTPGMVAAVSGHSIRIGIEDDVDRVWLCRFRDNPGEQTSQWQHQIVSDGQCSIPVMGLAGPGFDYQVGFQLNVKNGSQSSVFYPWQRGAF